MKRMPALFIGHGSPMLALDHNEMTKTLTELGKRIITDYGRPKAIAVVSAHWYSRGSYVNAAQKPEQIYDMYGFPQALYEVSYPALGDPQTARRIHDLTGAVMTEDWGLHDKLSFPLSAEKTVKRSDFSLFFTVFFYFI